MKKRCTWCEGNELQIQYHDREWGVPVHDDRRFFEFLILEGAQAGLSWDTILKKRDAYRKAFKGFDPRKAATFGPRDIERLLTDAGIVRNRLKVESAIINRIQFEGNRADKDEQPRAEIQAKVRGSLSRSTVRSDGTRRKSRTTRAPAA